MDSSTVAGLATTLQNSRLQSNISTATLRLGLDVQRQEGQAALQLLEAASQVTASIRPQAGQNINTFA